MAMTLEDLQEALVDLPYIPHARVLIMVKEIEYSLEEVTFEDGVVIIRASGGDHDRITPSPNDESRRPSCRPLDYTSLDGKVPNPERKRGSK